MNDAEYAISPRDSESGLPCSDVIRMARSSWFAMIRSNHRRSRTARSRAVLFRQAGKAAWAASMARRVSAATSLGTEPMVSPVAGLVTAIVFPSSAPVQAPAM